MESLLITLIAGILAGAMNAAAGGGSFVTIPALIYAGLPSVSANASSTVALLPGTLASAWAWRHDFGTFPHVSLRTLLLISVLGGAVGAVLLLLTSQGLFDELLPYLLLIGTLTFAFGRPLGTALRRHVQIGPGVVIGAQIVLSIYAGYFGGGVGIMMMAVWGLLGTIGIKQMNAARTVLVSAANIVATVIFGLFGPVRWPETLVLLVGAVIGGYFGAVLARRLPAGVLRGFVIAYTAAITALFFWKS